MIKIERFDDQHLVELLQHTDDLGVLSVYANMNRGADHNLQANEIDLKNRFTELRRNIAEQGWQDQGRQALAALDRLQPQLANLTTPLDSGRGRILFAGLDSDWTLQLTTEMEVSNRVVLDKDAFIHPLLELLDEGQPAGVVLASPDDVRIYEWRLGALRELSTLERPYIEAAHERSGHIGGGPRGQYNAPVREQRQSRSDNQTHRFFDHAVTAAAQFATERQWTRLLVSAGERWTTTVASLFPSALQPMTIADDRVLNGLSEGALSGAVTDRLREEHTRQEHHLVAQIVEAAHRQRGALGLSEVTAALNRGQVAHLIYDPYVRYVGSVDDNGAMYADDEKGPGASLEADARLTERMVERALATGARISPVEDAAVAELQKANGIAALLRW